LKEVRVILANYREQVNKIAVVSVGIKSYKHIYAKAAALEI